MSGAKARRRRTLARFGPGSVRLRRPNPPHSPPLALRHRMSARPQPLPGSSCPSFEPLQNVVAGRVLARPPGERGPYRLAIDVASETRGATVWVDHLGRGIAVKPVNQATETGLSPCVPTPCPSPLLSGAFRYNAPNERFRSEARGRLHDPELGWPASGSVVLVCGGLPARCSVPTGFPRSRLRWPIRFRCLPGSFSVSARTRTGPEVRASGGCKLPRRLTRGHLIGRA